MHGGWIIEESNLSVVLKIINFVPFEGVYGIQVISELLFIQDLFNTENTFTSFPIRPWSFCPSSEGHLISCQISTETFELFFYILIELLQFGRLIRLRSGRRSCSCGWSRVRLGRIRLRKNFAGLIWFFLNVGIWGIYVFISQGLQNLN
jgi:hypothetical protein